MSLHAFTPASPCPWLQTIGLTRSPDVFSYNQKNPGTLLHLLSVAQKFFL